MDDKLVLTLIDKFSAGNIIELELNDGNTRLALRKESAGASNSRIPISGFASPHAAPYTAPLNPAAAPGDISPEYITSPIVGTFYTSPGPDAPPFVRPGSKVKAGNTLCILEAMKMMNHLEAEFDCEIIEIHVSSGELAEYGQTLFTVKRL